MERSIGQFDWQLGFVPGALFFSFAMSFAAHENHGYFHLAFWAVFPSCLQSHRYHFVAFVGPIVILASSEAILHV